MQRGWLIIIGVLAVVLACKGDRDAAMQGTPAGIYGPFVGDRDFDSMFDKGGQLATQPQDAIAPASSRLSFLVRLPDEHARAEMSFAIAAVEVPTIEPGSCELTFDAYVRGAKDMSALTVGTVDAGRIPTSRCTREGRLLPGRYEASADVGGNKVVSRPFAVR